MRRVMIAACCLMPLIAGCGSKDGSIAAGNADSTTGATGTTAAAAAVDPCSLFTSDDVTSVVGDKVTGTTTDGDTCTYKTSDDDGLDVQYARGDAKAKMNVDRKVGGVLGGMGEEAARQGGGAGADVNVMMHEGGDAATIGDESLWGMNGQLSFRKGDNYVAITPPIMHDPMTAKGNPLIGKDEKRKIALDLAQKALAKLN